MKMIIDNPEALKAWLTTVLAPLCDADPAALAKYVLALAKKEKPESELRNAMIEQLDVFLQHETKGFVDLLFNTLDNKSYLQSNPEPPTTVKNDPSQQPSNGTTPVSSSNVSLNTITEVDKLVSTVTQFESVAAKSDDKKVETRDLRKRAIADKDGDRKIKRRSWSSRSRSRSRSRDRTRRSRSRDRNRERGGRGSWVEERDRRSRRSPVVRRLSDRRGRSRSPPISSHAPRRSSRSPSRATRRSYRSRSRSPKGTSPPRRSPLSTKTIDVVPPGTPLTTAPADPQPVAPVADLITIAPSSASSVGPTPGVVVAPLAIQSVVVTPIDKRPKFRCRDYDEKGYCMRGDLCPYDHGIDPVVLEDVELSSVLTYNRPPPSGPSVGPPVGVSNLTAPPPHMRGPPPSLPPPGEPYNPDAPGISWPPPLFGASAPPVTIRPSLGPRGGATGGPQGFNAPPPFGPSIRLPPPHLRGPVPPHLSTRGVSHAPTGSIAMGLLGAAPHSNQRELINVPTGLSAVVGSNDEDSIGSLKKNEQLTLLEDAEGLASGKKGHFDYSRLGGVQSHGPIKRYDPTNCCLEIKKIPRGLNNISVLNNHFSKFGKIVNLQVGFNGDSEGALITFASHAEAQAAYRSTEAVLNNRFIKVFWHNKESPEAKGKQENVPPTSKAPVKERLGGGGGGSGRILTQSQVPPVVVDEEAMKEANEAKEKERQKAVAAIKRSQEILAAKEALKKKHEEQKREATKLQVDLQRRKQELLDKQLQQQRVLIERLEKNKNAMKVDDRAAVMQTVRTLQETIEKLKQDLQHTVLKETNTVSGTTAVPLVKVTAALASTGTPTASTKKTMEETQRELLDAEIELYQKQQEGSDTTELQKKVHQLTQAAVGRGSLRGRGPGSGRVAVRGIIRGRGRGSLTVRGGRGRGHGPGSYYVPPHVSVDRRPTQLRVTGFETLQQGDILAFFANFGEVVDYEVELRDDEPSLVIRYKARKDAEMAFLQGRMFQDTSLTVAWHMTTVLPVPAGHTIKQTGDDEDAELANAGLQTLGTTSADEDEDENEGLEDLLNYEDEDEDEVERRRWRR